MLLSLRSRTLIEEICPIFNGSLKILLDRRCNSVREGALQMLSGISAIRLFSK